MLSIKLKRIGKKHQPAYRVVVSERRSKVKGQPTEDLGWFNPLLDAHEIKKDRVLYWVGVGAKPTNTVHNLLIRAGVLEGGKRAVHKTSKKNKKDESEPAVEPAADSTPSENGAEASS